MISNSNQSNVDMILPSHNFDDNEVDIDVQFSAICYISTVEIRIIKILPQGRYTAFPFILGIPYLASVYHPISFIFYEIFKFKIKKKLSN